jgi:hypothetical protein
VGASISSFCFFLFSSLVSVFATTASHLIHLHNLFTLVYHI